jgi:hypothetical protein
MPFDPVTRAFRLCALPPSRGNVSDIEQNVHERVQLEA